MKIVQLEGTSRTFLIDQGTITEVESFQVLPLEDFYHYGWLTRPETYAQRKERELREGFQGDLTGVFCTSRGEREFTRRTAGNAQQEVQSGTDRDVAAAD